MLERFYSGLECRAEGRRLIGPAIRYGEVSPSHRERFEPGAFTLNDGRTRYLDLGHDPERVLAHTDGGGLQLRDTSEALEVSATLPRIPAADRALEELRAGKLRGFSIEFRAEQQRQESGLRVVSKAALAGVGLVAHPSYESNTVEVRARGLSASIGYGTQSDCECHESGTRTRPACTIEIESISFDESRDVLATAGRLERAVASRQAGTLILDETETGVSIAIAGDTLEATQAGRELVKTASVVPVYARPLFDQSASKWDGAKRRGGVLRYAYDRRSTEAGVSLQGLEAG